MSTTAKADNSLFSYMLVGLVGLLCSAAAIGFGWPRVDLASCLSYETCAPETTGHWAWVVGGGVAAALSQTLLLVWVVGTGVRLGIQAREDAAAVVEAEQAAAIDTAVADREAPQQDSPEPQE
ncbi:hypothetical protein FE634_12660 [Nocardioides dongxiaopingii]|uniref:hypothetical protein n=1 Tax=Nocardioides sp. S-1144 TaxID=2582905 RepID=UPI00110E1434|nr:hypothetical protein [Nocardioides sp. S-1144]QCW51042.1 hypothetical protein FE634_12660 [Nocardioides sp. S-1144]